MQECFIRAGAPLSGVYFCQHHPEAVIERYRMACDCRKPSPGMILRAAAELNLNLGKSFLVGDKFSDIKAAEAAGVTRRFLVRTEHSLQGGGLSSSCLQNNLGTSLAEITCESLRDVADILELGGLQFANFNCGVGNESIKKHA
jgi:histidinol phosphatase-like enzyme